MGLLYSTYILQVFNFANLESFAKLFHCKFETSELSHIEQCIREIISTKKGPATRENLDLQNISAIRYTFLFLTQ